MLPSQVLEQHREAVRRTVLQFGMTNPRLFGSALHGDETDSSDLDLLIDAPARASLLDIARLQAAIEEVLGIQVDLLTPDDLPPGFRERVLEEAVAVRAVIRFILACAIC